MLAHLQAAPRPIGEIRTDLPAVLAGIVHRLLAKKAEDRYSAPAEVRSALAPFAAGSDIAGLIQRMAAVPQATAAAARGNAETETYVSSAAVETCPGVKSPTARPATGRRVGWKTMVGAAALAAVFLLTVLVAVFNRPIEEAAQTNKSNAEVSASKESTAAGAAREPSRERRQRAAEGREEGRRRDSQASRVPGSENASSCG